MTLRKDGDQGLIRAWSITLSRHLGLALVALGWTALIANLLGPEGTGLVIVATTLPALLAPVVNLGLPTAVGWLTAQQRKDHRDTAGAAIVTASALGIGSSAMVTGGVFIYGELADSDIGYLLLGSIGLIPYVTLTVIAAVYLGRERFGAYAVTLVAGPSVALIGAVLLLPFVQLTVNLLVLVWISAYTLVAVVSVLHLRQEATLPSRQNLVAFWSESMRYGWKVWIGEAAVSARARLDLFLVAWLLGSAAAGLYGTAVQIAAQVGLFSQAAHFVVFPVMSQADKSESDRRRQTPLMARLTLSFSLIAVLAAAVWGMPLIEFLFGSAFRGAYSPLLWYLPAAIFLSISRILTADISARGRPDIVMVIALGTLAVSIVSNLALIPVFGVEGAAGAASLTAFVNLCWRGRAYQSLSNVGWRSLLLPRKGDFTLVRSYFG